MTCITEFDHIWKGSDGETLFCRKCGIIGYVGCDAKEKALYYKG